MARRKLPERARSMLSDSERLLLLDLWEQRKLGELRAWLAETKQRSDGHDLSKRLTMLRYALLSGDPETISERVDEVVDRGT